ncbi:penicillin-binding protein activator LpoB [Aureibacter tunicatorum]|uniref:Penicillin-binding protein activator LpoB n=1 Tax=Aureibacter tunicatorum TaxID=866807 RepID=A0AAE3XM43_9BACT|nr:penicillin-binding protein activator LpoB [Aureibacter tunicatorum]MDR6239462.1 hypothetical protein [Aureibacter tunicatorum]BDD04616.1 penicillin-binding protein activator LpoB [Aureibacter tunicatorum]
MRRFQSLLGILFLAVLFAFGCSRKVTRVSPDQTIDLSGRWNDSDDRKVAQGMIDHVLSAHWIQEFERTHNRKPVVIVGSFKNKTAEHINPDVFIGAVEDEFINSGKVRVVQNNEFREKLRQERAEQQEFASKETAKKWGRELGADFMMFGQINSVTDEYKKEKVVSYTVSLELDDLETNEKVWRNSETIKKYINN